MDYKMPDQSAKIAMASVEFFAAMRGNGKSFTVLSLERGELNLGDEVRGQLSDGGRVELLNATTKEKVTVTVEDWGCSKKVALKRMQHYRPKDKINMIPELEAEAQNGN